MNGPGQKTVTYSKPGDCMKPTTTKNLTQISMAYN
ncbi:hypothetical protein SAMN04490198_0511 [Pseudomonas palleroniana]|uniref:Uncharacterized protein n=1 Tax=Pseudomonas palleroniana TaxID=191390 RepID=A0A1H5G274_9PSED|nr:hypothetical protein SAMN04490198_0511 [Pseudomonas palleroniana]